MHNTRPPSLYMYTVYSHRHKLNYSPLFNNNEDRRPPSSSIYYDYLSIIIIESEAEVHTKQYRYWIHFEMLLFSFYCRFNTQYGWCLDKNKRYEFLLFFFLNRLAARVNVQNAWQKCGPNAQPNPNQGSDFIIYYYQLSIVNWIKSREKKKTNKFDR